MQKALSRFYTLIMKRLILQNWADKKGATHQQISLN